MDWMPRKFSAAEILFPKYSELIQKKASEKQNSAAEANSPPRRLIGDVIPKDLKKLFSRSKQDPDSPVTIRVEQGPLDLLDNFVNSLQDPRQKLSASAVKSTIDQLKAQPSGSWDLDSGKAPPASRKTFNTNLYAAMQGMQETADKRPKPLFNAAAETVFGDYSKSVVENKLLTNFAYQCIKNPAIFEARFRSRDEQSAKALAKSIVDSLGRQELTTTRQGRSVTTVTTDLHRNLQKIHEAVSHAAWSAKTGFDRRGPVGAAPAEFSDMEKILSTVLGRRQLDQGDELLQARCLNFVKQLTSNVRGEAFLADLGYKNVGHTRNDTTARHQAIEDNIVQVMAERHAKWNEIYSTIDPMPGSSPLNDILARGVNEAIGNLKEISGKPR